MSYESAVLWSVVRSLIVGACCLWLGRKMSPQTATQQSWRSTHWMVPFFVPGLVVGYAYRNASLSLVQYPQINELIYLMIVIAQVTPVVTFALRWLPPAEMSPTGQFLLARTRDSVTVRQMFSDLMVGEFPRNATAFSLAALLCFQEVEVATLMQARGWTEWIFTKQAGGVELEEVWQFLILPVVYGLALIVPVLGYWIRRLSGERGGITHSVNVRGEETGHFAFSQNWTWGFQGLSWLLIVVWPLTSLALGAFQGRDTIHLRTPIWREIGDAIILAGTVTFLLWGGFWTLGWGRGPWMWKILGFRAPDSASVSIQFLLYFLCLVPGLLGNLALGLVIFEFCQRMGVSPAYSPLPLIAAMVLFVLPRALILRAMLWKSEGQSNLFLARTMGVSTQGPVSLDQPFKPQHWSRTILWKLQGAGRFWAMALLFWWSYLELTLPSLLRPSGMAPAPMRLYNFLHYGHIPGLAAMLVVVLAVPVLGGGLWLMVYRKILPR